MRRSGCCYPIMQLLKHEFFFGMKNTPVVWFFLLLIAGAIPAQSQEAPEPITPGEPIQLFNGKDLSNFYTWIPAHEYEDPNRVFSVVRNIDGFPAIRISGEEIGSLITQKSYQNYHLIAEYRWGPVTWEWHYGKYTRAHRARDSGIQIHCQGEAGNWHKDRKAPFMYGIQYQMREGRIGDIIMMGGWNKDGSVKEGPTMTVNADQNENGRYQYHWGADPITASDTRNDPQRIRQVHWYGADPDWANVKGYRGGGDLEKEYGGWNRVEIIAGPDSLIYKLNGTVVNIGTEPSVKEGKILIQSEYSEIYIRKLELQPLEE